MRVAGTIIEWSDCNVITNDVVSGPLTASVFSSLRSCIIRRVPRVK